jgi:hypothetical protein
MPSTIRPGEEKEKRYLSGQLSDFVLAGLASADLVSVLVSVFVSVFVSDFPFDDEDAGNLPPFP